MNYFKLNIILISFFLVVFGTACYSQEDSLVHVGYRSELNKLRVEYTRDSYNKGVIYDMACLFSLLDNADSAFYYLNLAIDKGEHSGWILFDPDFDNIRNDNEWVGIVNKINYLYILKHPDVDTSVTFKLRELYWLDQRIRKNLMKLGEQYGYRSIELDSIKIEMHRIDSNNRRELIAIIQNNGWPTRENVDFDGMLAVFTIVQHAPLNFQKEYLPFVEESVKNGDISSLAFVYFLDKMRVKENKKQLYGTQLRLKEKQDSVYELFPVEDEENLNKRRLEVGLEPIEDYLKKKGIEYKVPN